MKGLFLSDILFNAINLVGDPFGMYSNEDRGLLTPYVYNGNTVANIFEDPHGSVDPSTKEWVDKYIDGTHLKLRMDLTEDQYHQSLTEGSLDGMGYLPWSYRVIKGTGQNEGQYFGRKMFGASSSYENALRFNEWSGPLLWTKLQTIGILTAIGLAGYYGGKYAYRKFR